MTLPWTFLWKCCSITHLPFISSNSKILKAFLKTFPTKVKSTKRKKKKNKKWGKKSKKKGNERKWKVKVKTVVSLLNPKTILKFCFLHIPPLHKLIFCIWITRPQDLSNHTRMSIIQWRTPKKKSKKTMWQCPKHFRENVVPLLTYLSFHLILRS